MRILALIILFLITIGGWGLGALTALVGKSAIHEILSAVYFLTGTVAFCAAVIVEQMKPGRSS